MKQAKVRFPDNRAEAFSAYCYENKINIMMSWSKDDFFGTFIFAVIYIPEEFADNFRAGEYNRFLA